MRWWSASGGTSRIGPRPVDASPPACSISMPIGLASYSRRKRLGLEGSLPSRGYRNTPPRIRIRCTSATMDAIQRMLKSRAAHVGLAGAAFTDVALDRRFPEARVARVDGEFAGVLGNRQGRVGQDEIADLPVQREAVRALAYREHQHRRWSVQRVSRGDLLASRAAENPRSLARRARRMAQNGKDRRHRNVYVDVRRAIERIENQQIAAALEFLRNGVGLLEFLGGHARQHSTPLAMLSMVSLVNTSSFFCVSPCTFCVSSDPGILQALPWPSSRRSPSPRRPRR